MLTNRAEGETGVTNGRCRSPGDNERRLAGCVEDGWARCGRGDADACCMPNASRLSLGTALLAGFRIEGTAMGGSCVGSNGGSTGADGCQEAGRERPDSCVSGGSSSTDAFLFLSIGLRVASADADADAAVVLVGAGRMSSDEELESEEGLCDMSTLASRWLAGRCTAVHDRASPLSRTAGDLGRGRGEETAEW